MAESEHIAQLQIDTSLGMCHNIPNSGKRKYVLKLDLIILSFFVVNLHLLLVLLTCIIYNKYVDS